MAKKRSGRILPLLLLSLVILLIAGVAGFHFAARTLKGQIEQTLGKGSEVGSISLGLASVEIKQLRLPAPPDWPTTDALRAERIVLVPDWKELMSAKILIRKIEVEKPYLSVLRTPAGKVRLLPGLLENPRKADDAPKNPQSQHVDIDTVVLKHAVLDFYDASISKKPHRVRLEQLQAKVEGIHLPELTGMSQLSLDGLVKGVKHDGLLSIHGNLEIASKDSEITTKLQNVDLIALQPYLVKAAETGVKQGTLDLDIKSTVKNGMLHAPGTVTLSKLELASSGGFMGYTRQAAVGAMKDGKDNITLKFTLEGNINDPKFSLNENIASRFGAGLAGTLGVSVSDLTKSVGTAASNVGGTLKKLFGK